MDVCVGVMMAWYGGKTVSEKTRKDGTTGTRNFTFSLFHIPFFCFLSLSSHLLCFFGCGDLCVIGFGCVSSVQVTNRLAATVAVPPPAAVKLVPSSTTRRRKWTLRDASLNELRNSDIVGQQSSWSVGKSSVQWESNFVWTLDLELSSEKFVKILKSYKFSEKKSVSACYFVFSCLLLSLSNLIRWSIAISSSRIVLDSRTRAWGLVPQV